MKLMANDKKEMFVKISRSIEDNFLWHPQGIDRFDRRSAWIDLILLANYKEGHITTGNNHIVVKRGQFVTSMNHLASRWNWSKPSVIRYLRMLQEEGMIYKESTNRCTIITLVNYCNYQDYVKHESTASFTTDETQTKLKRTSSVTQSKNVKNDKELIKNEKNMPTASRDY